MSEGNWSDQERKEGMGEGLRTGLGLLYALKDAIEETVSEAVQKGDVGAERARQAVQDAWRKAQTRFDEAKEDFDLVPRKDFERLQAEVMALRERLERMEHGGDASEEDRSSGIIVEPE